MPPLVIFHNPPSSVRAGQGRARPVHVVAVLSTRALELAYKHAQVKSRLPYKHAFAAGVTVQLLSDGSVRLVRPDGRPLFKAFPKGSR